MFNHNTPVPKYFQLATHLRRQIESGRWQPHDQLPPEQTLAAEHNLSRGTVRKAIQTLLDDGLIERRQGVGTFVTAAVQSSHHFSLTSFSEEMRRQKRRPSTRVLTRELITPSAYVAEQLQTAAHEQVIHIERLRLADGEPVAHEHRYLAHRLCPGLMDEDLETQSIHWLLAHKYAIPLVRLVHIVERRPLPAEQAALLETDPAAPAFVVDRLSYTDGEHGPRPAVLFQSIYRADNFYLHTYG